MKKYKVNGMTVKASSISDAIHQLKDGAYSGEFVDINSASEITLTKIVEAAKNVAKRYGCKAIKIESGRVTGHDKNTLQLTIFESTGVHDYETWSSLPLTFRIPYRLQAKLYEENPKYGLQKELSEITKKLRTYENKTLYEDKTYRMDSLDSIDDSAASDIVREIKSKYPQVKVRQIAKQRNGYHQTILMFSNYPGEGATGFGNDPRTKERDNWTKFLKYLYTKYTGEKDDIDVYYDTLNIYDSINDRVDDSIKDASRTELISEAELAIKHLKNKSDKNALEYFEDIVKLIKSGVNDSIDESVSDARALNVSGWQFKDNELMTQQRNAEKLLADGDLKEGKKALDYLLHNVRECYDQTRELDAYVKVRQSIYLQIIKDIEKTRQHYSI